MVTHKLERTKERLQRRTKLIKMAICWRFIHKLPSKLTDILLTFYLQLWCKRTSLEVFV